MFGFVYCCGPPHQEEWKDQLGRWGVPVVVGYMEIAVSCADNAQTDRLPAVAFCRVSLSFFSRSLLAFSLLALSPLGRKE